MLVLSRRAKVRVNYIIGSIAEQYGVAENLFDVSIERHIVNSHSSFFAWLYVRMDASMKII